MSDDKVFPIWFGDIRSDEELITMLRPVSAKRARALRRRGVTVYHAVSGQRYWLMPLAQMKTFNRAARASGEANDE